MSLRGDKKKLLVVVGAGASVECGMPSVTGVANILSLAAHERYPLHTDGSTNLYRYFETALAADWESKVAKHLEKTPNFEDVLYAIFALAAAFPAGQFTSALGAFITPKPLPEVSWFGGATRKTINSDELREFGHFLVDGLLDNFRNRCRTVASEKPDELAKIRTLFASLGDAFEIAIITLNYDDIAYRSAPGLETGFDASGRFFPERLTGRSTWPCLLHLHGSVHFDMRDDYADFLGFGGLHDIHWAEDLDGPLRQNAVGRSSFHSIEGPDFPTSSIVAGYGKTTQILRRPFRTYFAEVDRLASECDAALFLGYGFADIHLNMAFEKFRDTRRRPVVVIDYAPDNAITANGLNLMAEKRQTAIRALSLFRTSPGSMRWLGHVAPDTVAELKAAKEFDLSSDPDVPLALWYCGMQSACDHVDKLLMRLR
jgi:hypothetical protein